MNELIREVAKEAGLQPFEDCGPGYVYKMEKFAELIVAECIDAALEAQADYYVINNIKSRLGVEE
jgi:hypothetical protein